MKLSAPVHRLKRRAKRLARDRDVPLHAALDQVAAAEGVPRWSLLAARAASADRPPQLTGWVRPGELLLIGARPRQGKTGLALRLAVDAMRGGRHCAWFSLEETEREIAERLRALGEDPACFDRLLRFDRSDAISAPYIVEALAGFPAGTLVVVDYLQLLDQRRDKPVLDAQIRILRGFARERRITMAFLAQIDRSYEPDRKPLPDRADIRLPNPLDLALFDRMCFLHDGRLNFV